MDSRRSTRNANAGRTKYYESDNELPPWERESESEAHHLHHQRKGALKQSEDSESEASESEASDDDDDDFTPAAPKKRKKKATATKISDEPKGGGALKRSEDSESEASDDDFTPAPQKKKATATKGALKRSEDSESEASDDDDFTPAAPKRKKRATATKISDEDISAAVKSLATISDSKLEKLDVSDACISALQRRQTILNDLTREEKWRAKLNKREAAAVLRHYWLHPKRVGKREVPEKDIPYLMAASGKNANQYESWYGNMLSTQGKTELKELIEEAEKEGLSLAVHAAKKLGLDSKEYEGIETPFVMVSWSTIKAGKGEPELNDKLKTEYKNRKLPVADRESKISEERRSKMSKANRDNYSGVGKSESTLKLYHDVQKEVVGSDTSRLWNWCKDGVPPEHEHLDFECKFLRDADESGAWNGAWIKNLQGFAVACHGKEYYENSNSAAIKVLGNLRTCGWREAKSNELMNIGKRCDNPELELFLFHKNFFPEGKGKKMMNTITPPWY